MQEEKITFNDLKFELHPTGGVKAKLEIGDLTISVIAGKHYYSYPREDVSPIGWTSFEVGIWNSQGDWVTFDLTQEIFGNDISRYGRDTEYKSEVLGWRTPEDIDEILSVMVEKEKISLTQTINL